MLMQVYNQIMYELAIQILRSKHQLKHKRRGKLI